MTVPRRFRIVLTNVVSTLNIARRKPTKLNHLKYLLGAIVVLVFIMKASLLHSADLITGRWECSGDGINGEAVQYVLDLKQSGEQVTGTLTHGSDTVDIAKGSIQGNKLELVVATDDNHYVSTGVIENNKITGSWKDDNGATGKWQGQRQSGN